MHRFVAWSETPAERQAARERGANGASAGADAAADPRLEDLIARGDPTPLQPPHEHGRVVILTSGTTGTPEGRLTPPARLAGAAAALFSKIPLRARETHADRRADVPLLGLRALHARAAARLDARAAAPLRPRGDAASDRPPPRQRAGGRARDAAAHPRAGAGDDRALRHQLPAGHRRVSGSALPGELATRVMDTFGDVLYNLYGSTEVAWATIATPQDLRAAPGTAGRPPLGTVVKLLDDEGREVAAGERGRIFVANEMVFEGYTGGGGKEIVRGLMSTGDVGHFDAAGRLFVDGRDDEMIVSGGENVFPREVEDLLADHPEIEEVAVIGVPDERVRPAPEGVRRAAPPAPRSTRRRSRSTSSRTSPASRSRARSSSSSELPRNATGKVLKRELSATG